jgi:hypothetical protein
VAYTDDDVKRLTLELAEKAQITPAQAERVMEALHLRLLPENSRVQEEILANRTAVNALGLSHKDVANRQAAAGERISINELRLTIKPSGAAGLMV